MDQALWRSWRRKLELFDAHGRRHFAVEEREGTRLKRRFFAFCEPKGRVLDLGCGTGFNRKFLRGEAAYIGVDPLRLAPRYSFPFCQAVGEYLPCKSSVFDSVICIATLDHVADPGMILRECQRVLRPGGTLGIMTKVAFEGSAMARWLLYMRVGLRKLWHGNLPGLIRGLRDVLTGADDDFHMHHFTSTSLAGLCEEHFDDVRMQIVGNVLFLRGRSRLRVGGAAEAKQPCAAAQKTERLRILHVVSVPEIGGAQMYVEAVVRYLSSQAHDLAVVCNNDPTLIRRYACFANVFPMPVPLGFSPWRDLMFFFGLLRLLRRRQFDIVQTSAAKASLYGRLAARLMGVPVVIFTAHGFPFHEFMAPVPRTLLIWLERAMSRWCTDMVVSVSELDRQDAVARGIVPAERIVTIQNGIDLAREIPERGAARHALGLGPDTPAVGMVGRLSRQKAPDDFVRAAALVGREWPTATFLIVGDGPLRPAVERMAAELGIAGRVRFTGFLDDVPLVMAALDVFVLSSHWEGLPFTLLEAMAAATPVVATAVNGVAEVVQHGRTGFLVPPRKVEPLAAHVCALLRDPALARVMGKAGQQRVREQFSVERSVAQLLELYHRLYRSKRGGTLEATSQRPATTQVVEGVRR